MKFLSAKWQHLLLANYAVDAELLRPFVPLRTRIDAHQGEVLLSLVAFMFSNTRVMGLPVPFHTSFEEVNLRFYVTPEDDPSQRAVTFIKEIVPRAAIPWIANSLFHENYVSLPMSHENRRSQHRYGWTTSRENSISGQISKPLELPAAGSLSEFITEHYWGYAKGPRRSLQYRVEHPPWRCCELDRYEIDVDFADSYGAEFSFLTTAEPLNVLYAEGSAVTVSFPKSF